MKIDKDVPMPAPSGGAGSKAKYPFRDMVVGDSFLHPSTKSATVSSMVHITAKRLGMKFAVRKEENGTRIWRIA